MRVMGPLLAGETRDCVILRLLDNVSFQFNPTAPFKVSGPTFPGWSRCDVSSGQVAQL